MGYASQTEFNVIVKSVGTADLLFKLEENSEVLDEVVVAKSPFRTNTETPLSTQSLSAVEIETYPGEIMTLQKSLKAFQEFLPLSEGLVMTLLSEVEHQTKPYTISMVLKSQTSTTLAPKGVLVDQ